MKTSKAQGLPYIVHPKTTAKWMVTVNIDLNDRLVNGAWLMVPFKLLDCELYFHMPLSGPSLGQKFEKIIIQTGLQLIKQPEFKF